MPDAHMDAAATPDGDDTLRAQVAKAVCSIAIGSERVETVMDIIREHTTAAVHAERERAADRDVHTEYAARFADGSIGVEQDSLRSAKAYAEHRAKQNRTLVGTPLEDPSGPATGYVKRRVITIYTDWEAVDDDR